MKAGLLHFRVGTAHPMVYALALRIMVLDELLLILKPIS